MYTRVCEPQRATFTFHLCQPRAPQGVQAQDPRVSSRVQAVTPRAPPHIHKPRGPPPCPRSRARRARLWQGRPLLGPAPGPAPRHDPVAVLVPGQPRGAAPQRQPPPSAATPAPPPWEPQSVGPPPACAEPGRGAASGGGIGVQPFAPNGAVRCVPAGNDRGVGVNVLPRSREYGRNCPLPVPGMPGPVSYPDARSERSLGPAPHPSPPTPRGRVFQRFGG